jgi:hypothetical protein
MKGKVALAILILVILISSALIGYYLEYGPGSNSPSGNPSLAYYFNSTINGGSFLGWNTAGYVSNNESDSVTIHPGGSLSRQFEALTSEVRVSFDWHLDVTMIIRRQLNGVYGDLTYTNSSLIYYNIYYAYTTAFDLDNRTTFTVRFESSGNTITFLRSVELWNSVESS